MSEATCNFAEKKSDAVNGYVCILKVHTDQEMPNCCDTCERYSGPSRGIGDVVKRVTDAFGVKPCGRCNQRRATLNRASKIAKSVASYKRKRAD